MAKAESRDRLEVREERLIERAAARACTVLLGFGAGTFLCGGLAWFHSLLDPRPQTTAFVLGVALAAAGIVPAVALRVKRPMPTRLVGAGSSRHHLADVISDRRTAWLLTGAVAVAAGVLTVIVVTAVPLVDGVYEWTLSRMLWMAGQRRAFEALLVVVTAGAVGGAIGLTAATLAPRFADPIRPEQSRSLVWGVMFGGALGVFFAERVVLTFGSSRQAMLLAAGAWFAVSLTCVWIVYGPRRADVRFPREMVSPPESTGSLEPIVIAGLVCWGAAIGLSGSVCARVAAYEQAVGAAPAAIIVTAWLLWLCAGVTLASVIKPSRRHSPAGCGFALWLSGVASASAAGALVMVSPDASFPLLGRGWVVRPAAIAVAMGGLFAGLALPYVKRALTRYGGGHPVTLADFLSAVLVGAGLGVYVGGAWLIAHVGVLTVQCLSGLLCIAVGGVLLLNERSGTRAWRVCRGVAVFGSLIGLGVVFPQWARRSAGVQNGFAAATRGSDWLFGTAPPADRPMGQVRLASAGPRVAGALIETREDAVSALLAGLCLSHPGQRACVIGRDAGPLTAWIDAGFRELQHWPHDALEPQRAANAADASVIRYARHEESAIGVWRTWRSTYDLLVLRPVGLELSRNATIWTAEAFTNLQQALGPGGRLAVTLPTLDLDAGTLSMVASGLAATTRGEVYWRAWPSADRAEEVWLVACNSPVDRDWSAAALSSGWRQTREIVGSAGPLPIHTFRTPRLGRDVPTRSEREQRRRSLESLLDPSRGRVR